MRRPLRAIAAAAVFAAAGLTAVVVSTAAHADTQICDQWGTTTIQGKYVVMNNRWGTTAQHCINVTSTGFSITRQDGVGNTSGAPVSYPAAYLGCHYTKCSPGTNLPIQVSKITSANSSISYSYVSNATYDAAYDIWLDPSPKKDGVNQMEIMIWFNRQGSIQPIGSVVGTTTIGGKSWNVWRGGNGSNNVISYVAPSAIDSWSFSVLDFIKDVQSRGAITSSWYLTSIQAGFEPWIGGAGLAVNSFEASVNGNGGMIDPTVAPTTEPTTPPTVPPTVPPTDPTADPDPVGACKVNYSVNQWNTGFTAAVTVTNNSASALNGWALTWSYPGNQKVASAWNATVTQSGSSVTARGVDHNNSIPAGGTASFGFQGSYSGTNQAPTSFALNGTACTVG